MKPERIKELAREFESYIGLHPIGREALIVELIEDVLKEQRCLCIDCDEPSGEFAHRCEECLATIEGWGKEE